MLLPRPEMRIATRRGSGMMRDGPAFVGAPAGRALDRAATASLHNFADAADGFAGGFEICFNGVNILCCDDGDHADAAIEGAHHFRRGEVAALDKQAEKARQRPARSIY